ncbi:hypothetical protein GFS31_18270 [Leptolyngbya sp. BL0902]|nr:hypothetical protein GFS31_18270 [Leptolyngbya sp. BL0902]
MQGSSLLSVLLSWLLFPVALPAAVLLLPEQAFAQVEQAVTPQRLEGSLDQTSQVMTSDGSYYNAHTFEGQAGQTIRIDMESREFDTFLWLLAPDGSVLTQNDDFDGTNSRIFVTLPTTGIYTLWANSYDKNEIGSYTLLIQPSFVEEIEIGAHFVEGILDQTSQVSPNDGSYYNVHTFEGHAGQTIRIDMVSEEFDTFLILLAPNGAEHLPYQLLQSDDSAGVHSLIVATLPTTGTYSLLANSHAVGDTGSYRLKLQLASTEDALSASYLREADGLFYQGIRQNQVGNFQKALQSFNQALELYRNPTVQSIFPQLGRQGQSNTLSNLASLYNNLGQYEEMRTLYEQQLATARAIGHLSGEGSALGGLGISYYQLGRYEEAISLYEQSLEINRQISDQWAEGAMLVLLGAIYDRLGQYEEAISLYEQSITIGHEIGDRHNEGNALVNLAATYTKLGQYQEAITWSSQSLLIFREINDRRGEGFGLNELGLAYYELDQFSDSTNAFLSAISIFDSLRTASLSDAEKVSFFDTYLGAYSNLQRSLVGQNKPEQALVYAEQGRARAFVELLANRIANNANTNVTSLESINGLDLAGIQRVAREQNATLVNYSVISEKSLFIWVVQPTGEIEFQQVDLGDENLPELVNLVRETLGARSQDRATVIAEVTPEEAERRQGQRQQQLRQLHRFLIEPIAQSLPTDPNERVVFIPHQDLFLVPFAALVDGNGDYLIENHTILTAPSIQVLDLTAQQAVAQQARTDRPTDLLIVGNPTMPSVWNPQTNQTTQLSNLPGAEREAIAIADTLDANALLSGNASKSAVVAQMPAARVIHLATHGLLEYGTPEDSGVLDVPGAIALAPSANDSGLLTAAEILQMNLNAELVVLSACDTGGGRITGDGVIGLSRAFVTAGVPSLMVSLWAVDDAATAEWMVTFYDQWEQTGDKAQAVRQAMLTTLENHPDPRLWAALTLMGQAE